jgi:hypothetical protein
MKELGITGIRFNTVIKNDNLDQLMPIVERARELGCGVNYLEQIPRYVRGEVTEPCRSGMRTIHLDPAGHVKRCPDFPADFHWTAFRKYEPINCNACYYACRGEAQAPLRISRIRDVMASPA